MKIKRKFLATVIFALCSICIALSVFFTVMPNKNNAYALEAIETSTGITASAGTSSYFTATSNDLTTKTIVFDIKTDGKLVQLQLKGTDNSGTGIIRTAPSDSRGVDTADAMSIENWHNGIDGDSAYWIDGTSVSLGDGWYRWITDISRLKTSGLTVNSVNRIKCISGSNVQIKKLQFFDGLYTYGNGSKLFLKNSFIDWSTQTIQLDVNISTGTQRRFQLCKTSGSGVSGIVRLTTTATIVENINNSPYWYQVGTPVYLGDGWYRHNIDLSYLKIVEGKSGTEEINQLKNLPDTLDPLDLSIDNLRVGNDIYEPSTEADLTMNTVYSPVGDKTLSKDMWIDDGAIINIAFKFDVYGLPAQSDLFSFAKNDIIDSFGDI